MKLAKTYNPANYEPDIYELWERSEAFLPGDSKDSFTILMPPPNANAPLHIGHALTTAIQDVLIRYNRMQGKSALYLPGADHAGFETWVVYEKQLQKEGKTRFDFSREELFNQVWDFVEQNKGTMLSQTRAFGASADWSRFTYTLDERVVKTAYTTFKKLWDDDLVYRGERIVNYCTHHDTSFSDIEVVYKDQKTKLWHISYPLTDGSGEIVVATTRPETMLGDTAVAVNPNDERYQEFIGKTVKLPLTNREIPIVADKAVEMEFGSGAVKVTPAHDQTDFDIAQRHDLPPISVIGFDGKITHHAPEKYRGMTVNEAREAVAQDLKTGNFLQKVEDYSNSVGHCYKCDTVIEPLLKDQWFVRMQPLAAKAIKAIQAKKIEFYPANKQEHAIKYLENVRDWNISRQIAWGIPIPAFHHVDNLEEWIYDERVNLEVIDVDGTTYVRDPDVFDTWFSSGQWPFVTLQYPSNEDFKRFYPTSVMETGGEIFNQWVLRMIMLGLYVTGEVPFTTVYIHGYVLAKDGTKMSKSLDNVVNPMDVINSHGSDALRMGLISGRSAGTAGAYSPDKIVGARNFANKLWNVARFVENALGDDYKFDKPKPKNSADDWVMYRLGLGVELVTKLLDEYRFSDAYEALYHLLWNDVADWYVEASKVELNQSVLAYVLKTTLELTHPFAPFVTETIWQTLTWTDGLLIQEKWPKATSANAKSAADFDKVRSVITEIRELKTRLQLRENTLYHQGSDFIEANAEIITKLSGIYQVGKVESGQGLHLTQTDVDAWLDVEHSVVRQYLGNLQQHQNEQQKQMEQLQNRLDNKKYVSKAPKALVSETKRQLKAIKTSIKRLDVQIKAAKSSLRVE